MLSQDRYWPAWAARAALPRFRVLDTVSSHGRYGAPKLITMRDLAKFHGHACDGLFRGTFALARGLGFLFPDSPVDRTDLRVLSRNSPCLGDAAAYLTGGRIRFSTQDVQDRPGVWFLLQRISNLETVLVEEKPGAYPPALSGEEAELTARRLQGEAVDPGRLDRLQAAQMLWVREVLLATPPEQLYTVRALPGFLWPQVPYAHAGIRTDILFKEVPEA